MILTSNIMLCLVWAIGQVESGGNPAVRDSTTGATGMYQMKQIALTDVNRRFGTRFTLDAIRRNESHARNACMMYLMLLAEYYAQAGMTVTPYRLARAYSQGFAGRDKAAAREYGQRVCNLYGSEYQRRRRM